MGTHCFYLSTILGVTSRFNYIHTGDFCYPPCLQYVRISDFAFSEFKGIKRRYLERIPIYYNCKKSNISNLFMLKTEKVSTKNPNTQDVSHCSTTQRQHLA